MLCTFTLCSEWAWPQSGDDEVYEVKCPGLHDVQKVANWESGGDKGEERDRDRQRGRKGGKV